MALRYPHGVWDPLGRQSEPHMDRHDIICVHTMVGSLMGTDSYFEDEGYSGVESTYGVGGSSDGLRDGQVRQWQDRLHTADANLEGSDRVISIETSDGGNSKQPWSPKQIDALVDLIAWECDPRSHRECPQGWRCREVGIPPRLIPDTRRDRRGLAYHRQGVPPSRWHRGEEGWLQPGCEKWSTVVGKVCPDDVRIRQYKEIVIPRVRGEGGGVSKQDVLDALRDPEVRKLIANAVGNEEWPLWDPGDDSPAKMPLWQMVQQSRAYGELTYEVARRVAGKVGAPVEVDTQAVVAGIVAAMDGRAEQIAALVTENVSAETAQAVAAALAARLAE